MTEKVEKKLGYFVRLRDKIPYKTRKLSDGTRLINEYDKSGFRIDKAIQIKKTLWEKLKARDAVKREHGGMPEFEIFRQEVK